MIHLEKTRKLERDAWLPAGLLVLWAAGWVLYTIYARNLDSSLSLCHIKNTTNIHCPTCGGTKASVEFFSGNWASAFLHNPLVTIFWFFGLPWVFAYLILARKVTLRLSRRGWQWTSCALLVLFFLNWVFLLYYGS